MANYAYGPIFDIKKEKLINYDSKANYYEFVEIRDIDNQRIKPYVLKKFIKKAKFKTEVVRDYLGTKDQKSNYKDKQE